MKNPDHLSLLAQFGLNEQEARVYLSLLELGTGTVAEIALKSGVKRTSIYNFIDRLVDMGVITHGINSRKRGYQAVNPEQVLERHEKSIRLLRDRIGDLTAIASESGEKPRITYYQGTKQIKHILDEQLHCRSTCLAIWPRATMNPIFGNASDMQAHNEQRVKSRISVRTILVNDEETSFPPTSTMLNEIRYTRPGTDFPMGMMIFDTGKVAFISAGKEMFGFIIESEDLYRSMRLLFETLWMQTELR